MKSSVVRAVEHAHRASQAKQIAQEVIGGRPKQAGRCAYCGAKTKTDVCIAHADLESR